MPRPPPSPVDLFPDLREGGGRTRCSRLPRQHRSKHRHRPLHHGTDANTRYSTPCVTLVKTQARPESPKPAAKAGSARSPAWRPLFKPPDRNSRPCTRSPAATASPALACQASATPSARPAPDPRHAEQASKRTFSAETDSYGRLLLIVATVTLRIVRISDHVMLMDFDPDITGIASQPFWLHWRDGT